MLNHDPIRYDFEAKLLAYRKQVESGCVEWIGTLSDTGYGIIKKDSKKLYIHRVIYEKLCGPIPAGMYVLHKCNNPLCSNIEHLYLGTQKDNMRDRSNSGRLRTDKYSNLTIEQLKFLASKNELRTTKMSKLNIPEGSIDRIILRARTILKNRRSSNGLLPNIP
jgi:hypothetical protein